MQVAKDWQKKITNRLTFITLVMWLKEIANCKNIRSVNPLYLMVDKIIGHFEEKNGNKYLVLDDVNKVKQRSFTKKMKKFGQVLKKKLND